MGDFFSLSLFHETGGSGTELEGAKLLGGRPSPYEKEVSKQIRRAGQKVVRPVKTVVSRCCGQPTPPLEGGVAPCWIDSDRIGRGGGGLGD